MINDGSRQRSQITRLTTSFETEVDHAALQSAFTLTNIDTNQQVAALAVVPFNQNGKTSAVLTFGCGVSVINRMRIAGRGNSLANGNYRPDILASQLQASNGGTTMNSDYIFGGQTAGQPNSDDFFRLYGDVKGDGRLNVIDLHVSIPTFFNSAAYREGLDVDGDGVINALNVNSLIPAFRSRGQR